MSGPVRKHAVLASSLTVVLTLLAASALWSPRPEASPEPGYLHLVGSAPIEDTLIATGVVRPAMTVEVRAQTSGLVAAVLVDEGDTVRRGQIVARLSSDLAEAAVHEAEAQLRQAYLQEAATSLDLDHQAVEIERRAYERAADLHEKGLVARHDVDQAQLRLRLAERALERNRAARRSSLAHIDQARANVARANAQLELTVIRAPFDATVLRRFAEVGAGVSGIGQSADGGTVLMTLGDAQRSAFHATVTAADAQRVEAGMPARVWLEATGGAPLRGRVHMVSLAGQLSGTSQLATFPVVVTLDRPRQDLVNAPARAEIVLSVSDGAPVVPPNCIRTDDEGRSFVLVPSADPEGGDERRDVGLGAIQPDRLEVRSGLEPGQLVRCR